MPCLQEPTDSWAFSKILDAGLTFLSTDLNDEWINEWMNGYVNVWLVDLNSGGNHFLLPFPEYGKWIWKAICRDLPLTLDRSMAWTWTAYSSAQQLLLNKQTKISRKKGYNVFFFQNELKAVCSIKPQIKRGGYLAFKN